MCGLFGAIGNYNLGTVRALAIVNQERGRDSLGFFNAEGASWKRAVSPVRGLADRQCVEFLARPSWFIAGHTRYATRGKITSRNAHPFHVGHIIGSHNGTVDAPSFYAVDSEFLFDELYWNDGDYQTAFNDIGGYWSLTWFDGEALYLQAHDNTLAIGFDGQAWYYSSDEDHLRAACGDIKYWVMSSGDTMRFVGDEYEILPRFVVQRDCADFDFGDNLTDKAWKAWKAAKDAKAEKALDADYEYMLAWDDYANGKHDERLS